MNARTSSPSPSLDALSSESSSSAFLIGWHAASTLPRRLWDAYVVYLWSYQPNSWVGRVASTFRIFAAILILPVVLLTLLDVASYVIARTLGVVDDVKASTSDADPTTDGRNIAAAVAVPGSARVLPTTCACPTSFSSSSSSLSHGIGTPVRASEGRAPEGFVERRTDGDGNVGHGCAFETTAGASMTTTTVAVSTHAQTQTRTRNQIQTQTRMRSGDQNTSDASPQAYYFAGEEDLRLAGEGVFSPAVSMPPSPLTPRMPLHTFTESDSGEVGQASEEGIVLRRRVQSAREVKPGYA